MEKQMASPAFLYTMWILPHTRLWVTLSIPCWNVAISVLAMRPTYFHCISTQSHDKSRTHIKRSSYIIYIAYSLWSYSTWRVFELSRPRIHQRFRKWERTKQHMSTQASQPSKNYSLSLNESKHRKKPPAKSRVKQLHMASLPASWLFLWKKKKQTENKIHSK